MCNSNDSTRWAGVNRFLENETGTRFQSAPEWRLEIDAIDIDLSEVDRLKFMGGEPMLHPNHEEFLDKLVTENIYSGRVTARYHTNGTVKPSDRVLEVWDQLGSVEVAFSIDGVDKMNDSGWGFLPFDIAFFSYYYRSTINYNKINNIVRFRL